MNYTEQKYNVKAMVIKADLYDWNLQLKCAKFAHKFDPDVDFEGVFRTQMWARLYPVYGLFEHMKENGYRKIIEINMPWNIL